MSRSGHIYIHTNVAEAIAEFAARGAASFPDDAMVPVVGLIAAQTTQTIKNGVRGDLSNPTPREQDFRLGVYLAPRNSMDLDVNVVAIGDLSIKINLTETEISNNFGKLLVMPNVGDTELQFVDMAGYLESECIRVEIEC